MYTRLAGWTAGLAFVVLLSGGCTDAPATGGGTERLAVVTAAPRLQYYEVFAPPGTDLAPLADGESSPPLSASPRSEGGVWYVALLSGDEAAYLRRRGFVCEFASRDALSLEALDDLDRGVRRGEASAPVLTSAASAGGPVGPLAPIPGCTAIPDTFCQYAVTDSGPCAKSIQQQLTDLATANPSFASLVTVATPTTLAGRSLYGIRLGPQSGSNVDQLFLFGGQHAREWAGTGLMLELAKRKLHPICRRSHPQRRSEPAAV